MFPLFDSISSFFKFKMKLSNNNTNMNINMGTSGSGLVKAAAGRRRGGASGGGGEAGGRLAAGAGFPLGEGFLMYDRRFAGVFVGLLPEVNALVLSLLQF
eukprot:TRINITY_DN2081_c0_g1_i2.p1 TRINITY_DN2081_c0_g1~~TRINITY_DN2081_c0_g1_i2.p1  ORF type:complete len:100 (+),score=5.54 TRINITY_DN2081_c0_g1_i2:65-364(+)